MSSIILNPVSNTIHTSTQLTGNEKLVTIGPHGQPSTVSVDSILNKVDDSIADRVEDQVTDQILEDVGEIVSSLQEEITEIDEKIKGLWNNTTSVELTKTTYSELKALRDNGQLSEGHLYRITDYVTTTTQTNTKSAGNVFDVIVLATSTNELSHNAKAIQHEGDTYFDGNDLGAWELWYDLDNDTEKYEWADATNGKGVIYRMIDEKRNDCPYDFKNILFYNTRFVDNTTDDKYYYTFSNVVSNKLYDVTAEKQATKCYNNRMGEYIHNKKKKLNKNVFRNISDTVCYNNIFDSGCNYNTFGTYCCNNTFGHNCYDNIF